MDKPYIAINEDGENDPNVCWERYKKRDDSIIVDLFQGQLKNKLNVMCVDMLIAIMIPL